MLPCSWFSDKLFTVAVYYSFYFYIITRSLSFYFLLQANWTFEYLARIQKMAKDVLVGLPAAEQFMTSGPIIDTTRVSLSGLLPSIHMFNVC